MFFLIFLRWVFYWIDHFVRPLLFSTYLYVVLGTWIVLAGAATLLFFRYIDPFQIRIVYKQILQMFLQNALVVMATLTMLYALFECVLEYVSVSNVFYYQLHITYGLTHGGRVLFIKLIIPLFLGGVILLSIHSVSGIAYQLQSNKKWLIYSGLMTIVGGICYGIYIMLGYV